MRSSLSKEKLLAAIIVGVLEINLSDVATQSWSGRMEEKRRRADDRFTSISDLNSKLQGTEVGLFSKRSGEALGGQARVDFPDRDRPNPAIFLLCSSSL